MNDPIINISGFPNPISDKDLATIMEDIEIIRNMDHEVKFFAGLDVYIIRNDNVDRKDIKYRIQYLDLESKPTSDETRIISREELYK